MTDSRRTVVFHEYALSPFSEKIRGGYRRIPVMQVGADVYRDTAPMVRKFDADELVIERKTDDLGRLWQHFPRVGYLIQRG
jgi:hypothetical protein